MNFVRLLPCLFVLLSTGLGTAQDTRKGGAAASVATVLKMSERDFLAVAEAMPDKLYTFAPPGAGFKGVRTFAEQVKHVACGNYAFFAEFQRQTPPAGCENGGPNTARTKAGLMQYLRESFAYADAALASLNETNMLDSVEGPYFAPNTRLGIATAAVWHASDHYGQLVEYLRMNGIIPPASRSGPPTR